MAMREEIELRKRGRMSRALLEKKWALDRARFGFTRAKLELKIREEHVEKLGREYVQALKNAMADEQTV